MILAGPSLFGTVARASLTHVFADGRFDYYYGSTNLTSDGQIDSLAWQPGLGLLVSGNLRSINPLRVGDLFRLDVHGNPDFTFTPPAPVPNHPVNRLLILPDKSILVARRGVPFTGPLSNRPPVLLKLMPNGAVDPSFHAPLSAATQGLGVEAVQILEDGSILAGGRFNTLEVPAGRLRRLVHLFSNGAIDSSYIEPSNITNSYVVKGLFPVEDGLLVAKRTAVAGNDTVVRIHSDGTEDRFLSNYSLHTPLYQVSGILEQPDGYLLVAGSTSAANYPGLVRVRPDGTEDTLFPSRITAGQGGISSLIALPDGGYFAAGNLRRVGTTPRPGFVRIHPDGTPDGNFGRMGATTTDGATSGSVTSLIPLHDGILIGGKFNNVDGLPRNLLAKLFRDGSLDIHFGTNAARTNLITRWPEIFSKTPGFEVDGNRIILCGTSSFFYGNTNLGPIVRLLPDGTLDWTYRPPISATASIAASAMEPDGSQLAAGRGITDRTTGRASVVRIHRDGTLDPDLRLVLPQEYQIAALLALHDGRILVASSSGKVFRYDSHGTLDTAFGIPFAGTVVLPTLAELASGDIYASGYKTPVAGHSGALAHWNPDGTFDDQFRFTYPGTVDQVLAVEPDRILVRGNVTVGSGSAARLFRCFADGSVDASFPTNRTAAGLIFMAADGDRLYLTGRQTIPGTIQPTQYDRVARYFNQTYAFSPPVVNETTATTVNFDFFAPPGGHYQFEASPDLSQWSSLGAATVSTNGVVPLTDHPPVNSQARFYRARLDN
jgi:uncharacterized delta-60 repeat protein